VGENKAFDADEIESGRQSDAEGFLIGSGQNLEAAGTWEFTPDGAGGGGHGRDNFGAGFSPEIGPVMHVFDQDGVDPGSGIGSGLPAGVFDDFRNGQAISGGSRKGRKMDHAGDGVRFSKQNRAIRHGTKIYPMHLCCASKTGEAFALPPGGIEG
jgi:hypothetical protein